MLFPNLKTESILQVNDKTRLLAKDSFVSKDEVALTVIEIEPEAGSGFIDVTGSDSRDWYLDWAYSTDGDKVVSLRVSNGLSTETTTKTISVLTEANDSLFSSDDDLVKYESEVLSYVPKGRSSFLNIHRQCQVLILKWLNDQGYCTTDGSELTKAEVVDVEQVRQWSAVLCLKMIFSDQKNSVGDEFKEKYDYYKVLEEEFRNVKNLKLDFNKNGQLDQYEQKDLTTRDLIRR